MRTLGRMKFAVESLRRIRYLEKRSVDGECERDPCDDSVVDMFQLHDDFISGEMNIPMH